MAGMGAYLLVGRCKRLLAAATKVLLAATGYEAAAAAPSRLERQPIRKKARYREKQRA